MTLIQFPAEIELTFPYRELEAKCGRAPAAFVIQRLWCDLAFQTQLHGKAGVYSAGHIPRFCNTMTGIGVPDAAAALRESGFVIVRENGDWFCEMFYHWNGHLDMSYIPPTVEWMNSWVLYVKDCEENALAFQKEWITQPAWYLPSGDVIPDSMMNRVTVLIHLLDRILRRNKREEPLDPVTVQAAYHVVKNNSPAALSVVLRRFMAVSRPRLNPLYPATTEEALRDFDDLRILISPDEGYDAWIRRIEAKAFTHEETPSQEAIADELKRLRKDIPGVHPQPGTVGGGEPEPPVETV
jgi:hypothetical protein